MSIVDGVSKFAREVHELAQDKGWWDDCACEEPGKVTVERRGKHEHPIWTFHPPQGVEALGLNVPAAMVEKHEFNKIREHRHGGRLA